MSKIKNIISGSITMAIAAGIVATAMLAPPVVDAEQHKCLALNIYHEARGEPVEGQIAVAHVTVNRVNHTNWPGTICEVVYEPKQFSWTHTIKNPLPTELLAWQQAKSIATDVMTGVAADPTDTAVFYHASSVSPDWVEYMVLTDRIGDHLFYSWDGDWNANN